MSKKRFRKVKLPKTVRNFENKEQIILRDFLALERTTLANERTLFAYIRTSLYLILAGIAFMELERFATLRWVSYVLFLVSSFLIVFGITRYFMLRRKLRKLYQNNQKTSNTKTDKTPESAK